MVSHWSFFVLVWKHLFFVIFKCLGLNLSFDFDYEFDFDLAMDYDLKYDEGNFEDHFLAIDPIPGKYI